MAGSNTPADLPRTRAYALWREFGIDSTATSSNTISTIDSNKYSANLGSTLNTICLEENEEAQRDPAVYMKILWQSKCKPKLLHACQLLAQDASRGAGDYFKDVKVEEVIQVIFQLMINHPLNSDLMQASCEVLWRCNERPEFRSVIEELEVFRLVHQGIKNHKNDPYFLGTAMQALASIAHSALSCHGLRQSEAYGDIILVLEKYKQDVNIQIGGFSALACVLRDDAFAQGNIVQRGYHHFIIEVMHILCVNKQVLTHGCWVLKELATNDLNKSVLLESKVLQLAVTVLQRNMLSVETATAACALIDVLTISEIQNGQGVCAQSEDLTLLSSVFLALCTHPSCLQLVVFSFSAIDHICTFPDCIPAGFRMEEVLKELHKAYQEHGSSVDFQESFCRCLGKLLEVNPVLHMFVGDVEEREGTRAEEASNLRVPLLKWVWVILLTNLHDTQHYRVFQAVALVLYYLVVDSSRLRKQLLDKGAVYAVFEGLRQYVSINQPKFEQCVQFGCRALIGLVMTGADSQKKYLVKVDAVHDLLTLLENYVTAPDVAADALGVIACLSDSGDFRSSAKKNIHIQVMELLRKQANHLALVESAIEVLIIYAELEDMTSRMNELGIFSEIISIFERRLSDTMSTKCLLLLRLLSDEEHLTTSPVDGRRLAVIITMLLSNDQEAQLVKIEALVCASTLCKTIPIIGQMLLEFEMDTSLFTVLYHISSEDLDSNLPGPEHMLYELTVDILYTLCLDRQCRQKMLLTAIKSQHMEAVSLLVSIGANIGMSHAPDYSDSPIYQAVLTRNKELVECLLENNAVGTNQLQAAFRLARENCLDKIIGLLLKKLALDKNRSTLNLGGFRLVEIKPLWIQPSLGLKQAVVSRFHCRRSSLDDVLTEFKRRKNIVESSGVEPVSPSATELLASERRTSWPMSAPQPNGNEELSEGFTSFSVPTVQQEEDNQLKPWNNSSLPYLKASPISFHYQRATAKCQRRIGGTASRAPNLPTVVSSPLLPSRHISHPDKSKMVASVEETGGEAFMGSMAVSNHNELNGFDEVDNGEEVSSDSGAGESQVRLPHRRHEDVARSATGAKHVSFSAMDKFSEPGKRQSSAAIISPVKRDTIISNDVAFSPKHLHRVARRSILAKSSSRYSQFLSPLQSSDEGLGSDSCKDSSSMEGFIHTAKPPKRISVASEHEHSIEKDEPDSAPIPMVSTKHSSSSKSWKIISMDISSNELKSLDSLVSQGPSIAKALSSLKRLDAKQNLMSNLPRNLFEELSHLTQLVLSQNSISVFPLEVSLCPTLTELDISNNKIEALPLDLEPMPKLVKLNLSSNFFREFPEALNGRNFPVLVFLDLQCNHIAQTANSDYHLKSLQELYLSRNALTKLPLRFLSGLTAVRILDVSRNKLEALPGEAADYMCSLQELKVGYNQLGIKEPEFHQFIKSAFVIQLVDATYNDLTSVPPPYTWRSRALKHLLLNNNKIASLDLADCDRYWPMFERLYIAGNRLKEIPPDIGKLRFLSCLDVSYNKDIRQFPIEMGRLDCLFYMNFKGLKNLDIDSTMNARGVVSYLKAKLTKSKPCYTMKMMMVGAAGKGKTTLLSLLISDKSVASKIPTHHNYSTVGITIKKWSYLHRPGVQYKISCWDFAGQEEFYSTHQCFLTPRSIYILVYDISKGDTELESVIPWLLNIQARAPASPVIIVGTHRDMISDNLITSVKRDIRSRVKEYLMKPGFPPVVSFAEISCIGAKVGLDELRNKIKEQIDSAKLRGQKIMGGAVPASYLELGDVVDKEYRHLIRAKSNFRVITFRRLQEIMSGAGLTKKMDWAEVEQAVQFLHETGALLHFNDIQSNLSDLYFLDPQWLCSMMAKIITVPQMVIVKKGLLKLRDIPLLLRGPQFPTEFHQEFIRLLERFEVALRHTPDYLLIPSFLPKEKIGPVVLPPETKIVRQYKMTIIPYGMWPRLVTRLLSFPRRAIQMTEPIRQMYWYSGVYSYWSKDAYFLIEQLEKSKHVINITVPRTTLGIRLLCSVVDNMEALIDEWFPGLRNCALSSTNQMVNPCALCPFCSGEGEPYSFPMRELQSLSVTEDSVPCPQHGGEVPMTMLAPDIVIGDLDPSYHIARHQLVLNENNPATVLGKGGYGTVHKACYNGRPIAAKIFSQRQVEILGTTGNQLIRQEVSILSQLTHPNIIKLVGVCMRPTPMLLMEYAELGSLSSFEPYNTIINTLKHRIALQTASALAFLHKNSIIYRDLKPGNILIFSLSLVEKVNAKLSDYGISAFATEGGLTQEIGTPGYKAPELLKAKSCKMPYDEKVDIYSYGIVFFQLITNGHAPFEELSPYERDRAVEERRPIRNTDYYGCPPWPDMQDLVLHCLQYTPSQRPSAQGVFDRLCQPEFMALNNVIPISSDWEVASFTIRSGFSQSQEECVEVWMSCHDMGQQSMLSVVNLSQKNAQPQGSIMPANVLVLSMIAIGTSYVLLGTNVGTILVYDGYHQKSPSHSLATLSDGILVLYHVKGRGDSPPYVFAGLANGQVAVFDHCVIQNVNATPNMIVPMGRGPVKKMKRYHDQLFVISGLEVFALSLSTLEITLRWIACTDTTHRYLNCLEVGGDMVWTSTHNCTVLQLWDAEDGNLRKTIDTYICLQSLYMNGSSGNGSSTASKSTSSPSSQNLLSYRVTALLLQVSANPLLWVGLAAGYLLVIDTTTCSPLMVTHRHMNSIKDIHIMRHLGQDCSTSVVLTCGFGFRTRPGHESKNDCQMNRYGVLLVWDSAMPRIKSQFDEIRKEQAPYR